MEGETGLGHKCHTLTQNMPNPHRSVVLTCTSLTLQRTRPRLILVLFLAGKYKSLVSSLFPTHWASDGPVIFTGQPAQCFIIHIRAEWILWKSCLDGSREMVKIRVQQYMLSRDRNSGARCRLFHLLVMSVLEANEWVADACAKSKCAYKQTHHCVLRKTCDKFAFTIGANQRLAQMERQTQE